MTVAIDQGGIRPREPDLAHQPDKDEMGVDPLCALQFAFEGGNRRCQYGNFQGAGQPSAGEPVLPGLGSAHAGEAAGQLDVTVIEDVDGEAPLFEDRGRRSRNPRSGSLGSAAARRSTNTRPWPSCRRRCGLVPVATTVTPAASNLTACLNDPPSAGPTGAE